MPDPGIKVEFTGNDEQLARAFARQQKEIDKLKGAYRDLAHQGKETGESLHIGSGVAGEIAGLAAGYLSVSKALEIAMGAHEAWKSVLHETTQATRDSVAASKSFAALQTGKGEGAIARPLKAVRDLAREFGVEDLGAIPSLVGGLQAARGGDVVGALQEAREILAVHRVTNAPLAELAELGSLAGMKGMDEGQFVREVAMAGLERKVSTETIMRGARSMGAFTGLNAAEEWIATQATLAKQLGPRGATAVGELPGLFMEGAPKEFTAWAKKQGVGKGAPLMDALGRLHDRGFTTVESLAKSGLDLKQRELLALAVEAQPRIVDLRDRLPGMSTEEAIEARHAQMIREIPQFESEEAKRRLAVGTKQVVAWGPEAETMSAEDTELLVKGGALTRMGMRRGPLGGRLVDESGRMVTGPWAWFERAVAHLQGPSTLIPAARGEDRAVDEWQRVMEVVREELALERRLPDAGRPIWFDDDATREWKTGIAWGQKTHLYDSGKVSPLPLSFFQGQSERAKRLGFGSIHELNAAELEDYEGVRRLDALHPYKRLNDAAESLENAASKLRGGPAMVPAGEDR